jgi:phage terminase large subunit-like protein
MMMINELITETLNNPKKHCQKQIQLCKLLLDRLKDPNIVYCEDEPKKVISFLEGLTQYQLEYAGKKIVLLPWQKMFIFALYGFKDKDGNIVYTDALLLIAKKNGKTLLGSGLILYELTKNAGAQVYTVATDYPQCKIAFENVKQFILQHKLYSDLEKRKQIKINDYALSIHFYINNSTFRCISEDRAKNIQGYLPAFVLFDEIASYKSSLILQKLNTAKPANAISLSITTAETNLNNPGYHAYLKAEGVLRGDLKVPNFLPFVYELDEEDDWLDPEAYIKANPSLDVTTTSTKKLLEERQTALSSTDPLDTSCFRAYKLNQWLRSGKQSIPDEDWQLVINNAKMDYFIPYLTQDILKTYPCFAAADLSKIDDYTAYSVCFWIEDLRKFYF